MRSTSSDWHSGHSSSRSASCMRRSFSNCFPHFRQRYSYIGIRAIYYHLMRPWPRGDTGRRRRFQAHSSKEMGAAISRFLVPALRPGGSHSSRPAISGGLKQPTRESSGSGQAILPYLVLLRVGFSLPLRSPATRCALTAPFHPYLRVGGPAGGTFSVALIRETGFEPAPPAVSRHAALWRPDFASLAPNDSGETLDDKRDCLPAPISTSIVPRKSRDNRPHAAPRRCST